MGRSHVLYSFRYKLGHALPDSIVSVGRPGVYKAFAIISITIVGSFIASACYEVSFGQTAITEAWFAVGANYLFHMMHASQ